MSSKHSKLVELSHPALRDVAGKVEEYTDLDWLFKDMTEVMKSIPTAVGLAAPQLGKSLQVFTIAGEFYINPVIINQYGDITTMREGCLSIPDVEVPVNRFDCVEIKYYNEKWEHIHKIISGFKARIVQHEYDHLNGILITDYDGED